jgi:hypothetical protein
MVDTKSNQVLSETTFVSVVLATKFPPGVSSISTLCLHSLPFSRHALLLLQSIIILHLLRLLYNVNLQQIFTWNVKRPAETSVRVTAMMTASHAGLVARQLRMVHAHVLSLHDGNPSPSPSQIIPNKVAIPNNPKEKPETIITN